MGPVLLALLLSGLMGMLGQGVRAIVGLKTMADDAAAKDVDAGDLFRASRLVVSLIIGFIAGLGSAFVMGFDKVMLIDKEHTDTLLGLAAAGYAGTDAIEAFMAKYLPGSGPGSTGGGGSPPPAKTPSGTNIPPTATGGVSFLSNEVSNLSAQVASLAARPSGTVPGSTYPSWALARDANIARAKYWATIEAAAETYELPIAVICAIGSKESQWGLALRPQGPAGTGDFTRRDPGKWGVALPPDGKGWGRGLMQIDWYSHDFAKTGDWADPAKNIDFGCQLLHGYVQRFIEKGMGTNDALRCGVSAYNGMSGAHSAYANDVMARADWLTQHGMDQPAAAV